MNSGGSVFLSKDQHHHTDKRWHPENDSNRSRTCDFMNESDRQHCSKLLSGDESFMIRFDGDFHITYIGAKHLAHYAPLINVGDCVNDCVKVIGATVKDGSNHFDGQIMNLRNDGPLRCVFVQKESPQVATETKPDKELLVFHGRLATHQGSQLHDVTGDLFLYPEVPLNIADLDELMCNYPGIVDDITHGIVQQQQQEEEEEEFEGSRSYCTNVEVGSSAEHVIGSAPPEVTSCRGVSDDALIVASNRSKRNPAYEYARSMVAAQLEIAYLKGRVKNAEESVSSLSRELSAAKQSLEMKRMFVRYVSHEIRTPLNTVSMGLTLLQDDYHTENDDCQFGRRLSGKVSDHCGGNIDGTIRWAGAREGGRRRATDETSVVTASTPMNEDEEAEMQLCSCPTQLGHDRDHNIKIAIALSKSSDDSCKLSRPMKKVDLADDLKDSCDIAISILSDLLLYEKLEGGLLNLERKSEPALLTIVEAVRTFAVQAKQALIDLQFTIDVDEFPVEELFEPKIMFSVDKPKLSQVVRNLVSNALKFGGTASVVSVHVSLVQPAFQEGGKKGSDDEGVEKEGAIGVEGSQYYSSSPLPSGADGSFVRVEVRDSGPGISPENQQKLFKEIIQFDSNRLQNGNGSGIGLFISRGIMDLHEGRIGVWSEGEGKGATFHIDIPLDASHEEGSSSLRSGNIDMAVGTQEEAQVDINTVAATAAAETAKRYHKLLKPGVHTQKAKTYPSPDRLLVVNLNKFSQLLRTGDRSPSYTQTPGCSLPTPQPCQQQGASVRRRSIVISVCDEILEERKGKGDGGGDGGCGCGLEEDDAGAAIATSATHCWRQPPSRVLIVDDARTNRRMARKLLQAHCPSSMEFEEAENGREALDLVLRSMTTENVEGAPVEASVEPFSRDVNPYVAILMDYLMPVMDGPTATAAMRKAGYKGLIVGITGNMLQDEIDRFRASGADEVMGKPLDHVRLEALLNEAARQKEEVSRHDGLTPIAECATEEEPIVLQPVAPVIPLAAVVVESNDDVHVDAARCFYPPNLHSNSFYCLDRSMRSLSSHSRHSLLIDQTAAMLPEGLRQLSFGKVDSQLQQLAVDTNDTDDMHVYVRKSSARPRNDLVCIGDVGRAQGEEDLVHAESLARRIEEEDGEDEHETLLPALSQLTLSPRATTGKQWSSRRLDNGNGTAVNVAVATTVRPDRRPHCKGDDGCDGSPLHRLVNRSIAYISSKLKLNTAKVKPADNDNILSATKVSCDKAPILSLIPLVPFVSAANGPSCLHPVNEKEISVPVGGFKGGKAGVGGTGHQKNVNDAISVARVAQSFHARLMKSSGAVAPSPSSSPIPTVLSAAPVPRSSASGIIHVIK